MSKLQYQIGHYESTHQINHVHQYKNAYSTPPTTLARQNNRSITGENRTRHDSNRTSSRRDFSTAIAACRREPVGKCRRGPKRISVSVRSNQSLSE